MAQAKGHDGSARTAKFETDLTFHGYADDDLPRSVYVEVSADANNTLLAIIAAGDTGRYSFDFGVDNGCVEVARAFEEGMRVDEDELPDWMDAVREEIEQRVLN